MRSRVYETVKHPSVCPIDRLQQRLAAGLLLSAPQIGDIDLLLHSEPAAGALQHAPALSSKCGQCHVDSRWTRLNTDLFVYNQRTP